MSTEAIPIFTSHRFFYKIQTDINEDPNMLNATVTPKTTSVRSTFTCKK